MPGKLIHMEGADVHTGGSVANTGLALKILGNDVMLMGKAGADAFGGMKNDGARLRKDRSEGLRKERGTLMKRRSESFFGLHFDFHASPEGAAGTSIGATLKEEEIREICRLLKPDFLQIDCKGHPGWASYPTAVGNAMPDFALDPLALWRKVTREEGVALYMHYSGVIDKKYLAEHPGEGCLKADGTRDDSSTRTMGRYVDELLIPQLTELAEKYGVHCHTYNEDHIVSRHDGECMNYYRRVIKTPLIVTDDVMSELQAPPSKMIAIELHDHDKQERFRKALYEMTEGKLTLLYSNPYYMEIFPAEAGKGSAVKRLADILEIPLENTYAAGDEQNDISMIEAAGCGIAMINGTELVKKSANVVTSEDNNNDGLAPFILQAIG